MYRSGETTAGNLILKYGMAASVQNAAVGECFSVSLCCELQLCDFGV